MFSISVGAVDGAKASQPAVQVPINFALQPRFSEEETTEQFIPHAAKNNHTLFIRTLRAGRRIFETVMQPSWAVTQNGVKREFALLNNRVARPSFFSPMPWIKTR
jgi:hypothetical protein